MTGFVYYTATSLDGFIADPNDSLDWLLRLELDRPEEMDGFIAGAGAMLMGATTYEWSLAHVDGEWPYDVPLWVMTHRDLPRPAGVSAEAVRLASGPIEPVHAEMSAAAAPGSVLWVVGGGDLAGQCADAGLLDEVVTSIAPVTLGAGRALLPRRLELELVEAGRNGPFVTARHRVLGTLRVT